MYKHCYQCGVKLPHDAHFPYTCSFCHAVLYLNPVPVGVALLPVGSGLLVIQRALKDGYGQWALPGGFLEAHETWQEGILRELYEETGILLAKDTLVRIFSVQSDNRRNLLLFAELPPVSESELPQIKENTEVLSMKVIYKPEPLAFPVHEQIVKQYFAKMND